MAGNKRRDGDRRASADDVRETLLGGLIWAPWRMQYVSGLTKTGTRACPFCPMVRARRPSDEELLVLYRGRQAFVVMNLYPYTPGHLVALPKRHVGALDALRPAERNEMWELANLGHRMLAKAYRPVGFNIGMNLGRAGGAAVVGHVHMHVVPRYHGDSNFLATTGGARQCPEGLDATYARLRPLFDAQKKRRR